MLFDLALISVILSTGYLGPQVLRLGPGPRVYAYMLLGTLALAVFSLLAGRSEDDAQLAQALGAVAIFAAVLLVFVPPFLRDVARRALGRSQPRFARFATEIREHLQPGMGAREEKEFIDMVIATEDGREQEAIAKLLESRPHASSPRVLRRLDERLVMTYLYARRWQDAINHFEGTLARMDGPTSTQLLVEIIRAYCEAGQLDKAGNLLRVLETSGMAEEVAFSSLINRARLMFLAFVGRSTAVEGMMSPGGPLDTMPVAARRYWTGLARLHAGDRKGATEHLEAARDLAGRDGRAREHAQETLSTIDSALGPHVVPAEVAELADSVSAKASEVPRTTGRARYALRGVGMRRVPATSAMIGLNLLAAAAMWAVYGSSSDIGALILAGGNVKSATASGEYYRLVTSMFLHAGWVHLALNMYGLWTLGKLVEQFVGSLRFLTIYMGAGLGGALASFYFGGPATSVGASGAVFGVLGAGIIELWLGHNAYPPAFRRSLLGNFLFFAGASILIGFSYPQIDLAAHIGGFVVGGLLTALLAPRSSERMLKITTSVATGGVIASIALLGWALYEARTRDFSQTLRAEPRIVRQLGNLVVQAPASWLPEGDKTLADAGLVTAIELQRGLHDGSVSDVIKEATSAELLGGAQKIGFDRATPAEQHLFKPPAPWQSDELMVSIDASGGQHRFRAVVFARPGAPGEIWVGNLYAPELLAPYLNPVLAGILASAKPPH